MLMLTSKQKRREAVRMARRRDPQGWPNYNFPLAMRPNTTTKTVIRKLEPFFSSLPDVLWDIIKGFAVGGRHHPYASDYVTKIASAFRGFRARLWVYLQSLDFPLSDAQTIKRSLIRRRTAIANVRGEYVRRIRYPESDYDYIGPWSIGYARWRNMAIETLRSS